MLKKRDQIIRKHELEGTKGSKKNLCLARSLYFHRHRKQIGSVETCKPLAKIF